MKSVIVRKQKSYVGQCADLERGTMNRNIDLALDYEKSAQQLNVMYCLDPVEVKLDQISTGKESALTNTDLYHSFKPINDLSPILDN